MPWSPTRLPMPHSLVIDLGTTRQVGGFKVLPRRDSSHNGGVAEWRFPASTDGFTWAKVTQGTFTASTAEQSRL